MKLQKDNLRGKIANICLVYGGSGLAFLSNTLTFRVVGENSYSWIALGIAAGAFVSVILNFGTDQVFLRELIRSDDPKVVDEKIRQFTAFKIAAFAVSFTIVGIAAFFYASSLLQAIVLTLATLWTGALGLYPNPLFDFSQKFLLQNIISFLERAVSIIFLAYLAAVPLVSDNKALWITGFLLGTRMCSIILQFKVALKALVPCLRAANFTAADFTKPWGSWVVVVALLATASMAYGTQMLLHSVGRPEELSNYAMTFQVLVLGFILQTQIVRFNARGIAEEVAAGGTHIGSMLKRGSAIAIMSICILPFLYTIGKYFVPYVVNSFDFQRSLLYLPVLFCWLLVAGVGQIVTQYGLMLKKDRQYSFISLIYGGISLLAGVVFIPRFGCVAVSWILLITHAASILTNGLLLLRVPGCKLG